VTLPPDWKKYAVWGAGVLVVVATVNAMRDDEPARTAPARGARAQASPGAQGVEPVEDVKLELLQERRAELADAERNPFRFRPRPAPAPPPRAAGPAPGVRPVPIAPPVPTGPPPPPPIPLKFIGLVETPVRVAFLSDGRGNTFQGKEGDIIEGRYRIVRIGADAAELAYVDGRGRQTIRLTGQ
jgi:hypothetical protein